MASCELSCSKHRILVLLQIYLGRIHILLHLPRKVAGEYIGIRTDMIISWNHIL